MDIDMMYLSSSFAPAPRYPPRPRPTGRGGSLGSSAHPAGVGSPLAAFLSAELGAARMTIPPRLVSASLAAAAVAGPAPAHRRFEDLPFSHSFVSLCAFGV